MMKTYDYHAWLAVISVIKIKIKHISHHHSKDTRIFFYLFIGRDGSINERPNLILIGTELNFWAGKISRGSPTSTPANMYTWRISLGPAYLIYHYQIILNFGQGKALHRASLQQFSMIFICSNAYFLRFCYNNNNNNNFVWMADTVQKK